MGWRSAALPLIGLLAAGCAVSVVHLRDTLDLNQATFHDKLGADQGLAREFTACTARPYDERGPVHAETSPQADGPDAGPMRAIHELVTRVREGPAHAKSLQILEETLADWTATGYQRLDLRKLRQILDVVKQWHLHLDFDEDALAEETSTFAQLLLAYNKAYFGDIRYTATPQTTSGIRAAAKVTSHGFTDRNGNVWKFPGLSLEVTAEPGQRFTAEANRVDSQGITADLTRVFLEAFFDAAFRAPAVRNATALEVQWKAGRAYPAFDADHPPIPLEAFGRVTRDALRAEAAVTSEVGKAVRGGSLFSTQNETFAAGMETAAGVIAKKLVEHAGICYFQIRHLAEGRKEGIKDR
jgi:hypothetical protein